MKARIGDEELALVLMTLYVNGDYGEAHREIKSCGPAELVGVLEQVLLRAATFIEAAALAQEIDMHELWSVAAQAMEPG